MGPVSPRIDGSHRLRIFLCFLVFLAAGFSYASAHALAAVQPDEGAQMTGVSFSATSGIQLLPDPNALLSFRLTEAGGAPQYGAYLSPVQTLATPGSRIRISYDADQPTASRVFVDVRVSADGEHWTPWEVGLANGAVADFPLTARLVQYRARLFGSAHSGPTLRAVELATLPGPPLQHAAPATTGGAAPTFRIHATRLGLVGWRTANGHIIQPRDRFVALPSWRSLSSRGGHEYQVRLTYQGRSVVAPVWDVGPWNTRDDYWSPDRELYKDLPQGWPQDHAAYFEGHNGGYAQYGYVTLPTAMDVGDGLWWDALGIPNGTGTVQIDVTFLWMGRDPLDVPAPSSDPNAHEYMVDEQGTAFHPNQATWFNVDNCGHNDHTLWTISVNDTAKVENKASWHPTLPLSANYDVYAHVPDCPADRATTSEARYLVQHGAGAEEIVVNQAEARGDWVLLGRFPFEAGDSGFVYLTDLAGDQGRAVWFDNVKWIPIRETDD